MNKIVLLTISSNEIALTAKRNQTPNPTTMTVDAPLRLGQTNIFSLADAFCPFRCFLPIESNVPL